MFIVKFYWDTATLLPLRASYGCFYPTAGLDPQNLKFSLPGPLQKNAADPSSGLSTYFAFYPGEKNQGHFLDTLL